MKKLAITLMFVLMCAAPLAALSIFTLNAPLLPKPEIFQALFLFLALLFLAGVFFVWYRWKHIEQSLPPVMLMVTLLALSVMCADVLAGAILGPVTRGMPSVNAKDKTFWTYQPNTVVNRGGVLYRFNSWGFRGPEPQAPAKDTIKILLLGDSIPFGGGYPESETFPRLAETLVNKELDGSKVEVMNASFPGVGIKQLRELYFKKLYRLPADIVILCFYIDDINRETLYRKKGVLFTPAWPEWIQDLYYFDHFGHLVLGLLGFTEKTFYHTRTKSYVQAWLDMFRYLEEFRRECAARRMRLVVLNIPQFDWQDVLRHESQYKYQSQDTMLESWCLKRSVPYFRLLPFLLNFDVNLVRTSRLYPHFNLRGHRMVAGWFKGFILDLIQTSPKIKPII